MNTPRQLLPKDRETIVALATPRGSGAIGMIRLSGDDALLVASKIAQISSKKDFFSLESHTIHHGFVVDPEGKKIDEVLFFVMHAPKTFTGQDTVEISCHNNQFIIEKIIQVSVAAGARQASPGEFTMRGFLYGKFDLTQAEAINEIINAPSDKALQSALSQLKGSLSERIVTLEHNIIELLTLCEASFEFLEEEQRDLDFNKIARDKVAEALSLIAETKKHFNIQQHIKDGIRIALIGSVNAGKSSLFNALLGKNRAIISNIAGTTRDSIEANLYKNGTFWLLVDTAGLRKTNDLIEQKGIERSYEEAIKADLILLVIDASRPIDTDEARIYDDIIKTYHEKTVVVLNKSDVAPHASNPFLAITAAVSAATRLGIEELEEVIAQKIEVLFQLNQTTFVLSQRQYNLIDEIEKKLLYIESSLTGHVYYELVAYELKDLLEKVCELTGKHISEEILDTVFSKFCVGK